MPIRYRCSHCQQLLSITTRRAGTTVDCPTCGRLTLVPLTDAVDEVAPQLGVPRAAPGFPPGDAPPVDDFSPEPSPDAAPNWDADNVADQDGGEFTAHVAPAPALPTAETSPADRPLGSEASDAAESAADDQGFALKRRGAETDEMDLTPMVDMTFLLLIFFMITASFSVQKSLDVPTPPTDEQGAAQTLTANELEQNSIRVRIDAQNSIVIEDEMVRDRNLLKEALQTAMRKTRKRELDLTVAGEAFHDTVIAVIDAANAAGLQRIRLVSGRDTE